MICIDWSVLLTDSLCFQVDQWVLKDFLGEKLPRLATHFEDHSIDVSLITFNWFLVVFVESLPSDILLPLWDAFLYEGTKVPSTWMHHDTRALFRPDIIIRKCQLAADFCED